ncbi:flagellar export chaperone FliS [Melaminivora sp.]|uniref:flagellar export chaperone FliS n=1 Tax=Melaminivora sp. TaxID=1933032 RepID=UPI0028B190EE|nr:flagellar export chaperone FliS [Melaminivora sp.]
MFNAFSSRSASAYQRINVETSMPTFDPHQLVALLYEGVLNAIASARGALARNDVQAKCDGIGKAVRILEEGLLTALDREAGGELAASLEAVYDYSLRRLIQANMANDDAMLQEVARLIEPISQAWRDMKNPAAAAMAAANDAMPSALVEA